MLRIIGGRISHMCMRHPDMLCCSFLVPDSNVLCEAPTEAFDDGAQRLRCAEWWFQRDMSRFGSMMVSYSLVLPVRSSLGMAFLSLFNLNPERTLFRKLPSGIQDSATGHESYLV